MHYRCSGAWLSVRNPSDLSRSKAGGGEQIDLMLTCKRNNLAFGRGRNELDGDRAVVKLSAVATQAEKDICRP